MKKRGLIGILIVISSFFSACGGKNNRTGPGFFPVRLDSRGPYLILYSKKAGMDYSQAIALAKTMHPQAREAVLELQNMEGLRPFLKELQPFYCLIFIEPDELDVDVALRWLEISSAIDADPFIDVRTGYITGENPAAVLKFVERIRDAAAGKVMLPASAVDVLGPNEQLGKKDWQKTPGSFMIPVLSETYPTCSISHGLEATTRERLSELSGAGLIHFGGHGYPDRIVNCLNGPFVRGVPFSPSVVFNGACYTGVTGRWFDASSGMVKSQITPPELSFCLGILTTPVVAYLAALHPDHGMPVYQEMEYIAYTGFSLGETIKHTYDGVILVNDGKSSLFDSIGDGSPTGQTPAKTMLKGTASRVLFGDPSLKIMNKITESPFQVDVTAEANQVVIRAAVKNTGLKSSFTDTYFSDLSKTGPFNDRILLSVEWPAPWQQAGQIQINNVQSQGKPLSHRLAGYAWEKNQGKTFFHIQIDVESTGFFTSPLRVPGAGCMVVIKMRP